MLNNDVKQQIHVAHITAIKNCRSVLYGKLCVQGDGMKVALKRKWKQIFPYYIEKGNILNE